jgi:Flp pilus assembly protein TadG
MHGEERGTGAVSALLGVTIVFVLLFFSAHLLLGLYSTSIVTAVTWDAARMAAGEQGSVERAERYARDLLGERAGEIDFAWAGDGDSLTLTVRADNPRLLWPALMSAVGAEEIERTVNVRVEEFREEH